MVYMLVYLPLYYLSIYVWGHCAHLMMFQLACLQIGLGDVIEALRLYADATVTHLGNSELGTPR